MLLYRVYRLQEVVNCISHLFIFLWCLLQRFCARSKCTSAYLITQISPNVLQNSKHDSKEVSYLTEQQAAAATSLFPFLILHPSLLTFSPFSRPLFAPLRQPARPRERLETMHQSLQPRWDRLPLRPPGAFPGSSQILGPLCGCQEQGALIIGHCN